MHFALVMCSLFLLLLFEVVRRCFMLYSSLRSSRQIGQFSAFCRFSIVYYLFSSANTRVSAQTLFSLSPFFFVSSQHLLIVISIMKKCASG